MSQPSISDFATFSDFNLTTLHLHDPYMDYESLKFLPSSLTSLFLVTGSVPIFRSSHMEYLSRLKVIEWKHSWNFQETSKLNPLYKSSHFRPSVCSYNCNPIAIVPEKETHGTIYQASLPTSEILSPKAQY